MQTLRYRDFILTFEPDGAGGYIALASSPEGQGRVTFRIPFSDDKLELLVLKLGRTRSRTRGAQSPELAVARELGGALFDVVFTGEVRDCLRTSMNEVLRAEDEGLRIKLRLQDAPGLAELPWELLLDATTDTFLAQSIQTPVVRWIDLAQPARPLRVKPPLRILVMISSPTDYPRLDVDHEKAQLVDAMRELADRDRVEITVLETATMSELQRLLRNGRFHIFHFIGHGEYDIASDGGFLVLEDEDEKGARVDAHRLSALLRDHRSLRLAVLNACEGARNSRADPFAGVATTLVRQSVPAVIAMQFEITDAAAIGFAREFYGAIADGVPLDAAVSEARKAIYALPNDTEWATPVLYMRTPDGVIFDVAADAEKPPVEDAPRPVQFTAHRPETIRPERWYPFLVSAHVVDRPEDRVPGRPTAEEEARREVEEALRDAGTGYAESSGGAAAPVAEGSELLFLPRVEGVTFDPPHCTIAWRDVDWAIARFRLKADRSLAGNTASGSLLVLNGPVLVAEMSFTMRVGDGPEARTEQTFLPYRRIFVSYARSDEAIVRRMEAYARAIGDEYLRDVTALRTGESRQERLLDLIDEADIFQLFWSHNALESDAVDREVRHALSLGRPHFVRPFYWESTKAADPARNRPPAELRDAWFQRIDIDPPPVTTPPAGGDTGLHTRTPPAPTRQPPPRTDGTVTPGPTGRKRSRWMMYATSAAAVLATIVVVTQLQTGGEAVAPPQPGPDSVPTPVADSTLPPDSQAADPIEPAAVASIQMAPRDVTLDIAERASFRGRPLAASDEVVADAQLDWAVADSTIAAIVRRTATGVTLEARSPGSTDVSARVGAVTATARIRVRSAAVVPPPPPPPPPAVEPVTSISGGSVTLSVESGTFVIAGSFTASRTPAGPVCLEVGITRNGSDGWSDIGPVSLAPVAAAQSIDHTVPFADGLPDIPSGERRARARVRIWDVDCGNRSGPPVAEFESEPLCMVRFPLRDWRREACRAEDPATGESPR